MENKFFDKIKNKQDFFDKHPLCKEDIYIKNIYMSMLFNCGICDGDLNENEIFFLENMCRSVGIEKNEVLKYQYEDFDKQLQNFKYDFINNKIIYTFICDITLLSCIDSEINDEEIAFICNLAELINLDKRWFEYFFRIAQLVINETEENYLIAVLSRPKNVDFKYFRFYFDNYGENGFSNYYILEVLKYKKILETVKSKLMKIKNKKLSIRETIPYLNSEILEEFECDIDNFEEICREVEKKTNEYLTINNDDVYCEMLEDLSQIQHLCNMMFVNGCKVTLLDMKIDYNLEESIKKLTDYIDDVINYIDELTKNK